jgi:hypothetical protein
MGYAKRKESLRYFLMDWLEYYKLARYTEQTPRDRYVVSYQDEREKDKDPV